MALPQIIAYPIPSVAGGFHHENNLIELRAVADRARGFIENSRSDATKRAYRSDWIHFSTWCESRGFDSLPATAESILLYLSKFSESLKISSLSRHLVSISQAHKLAGYPSPTKDVRVREMLTGMKRTLMQSPNKKKALRSEHIRKIMSECVPDSTIGKRDRALLLVGFTAALRRSEIEELNINDIEFVPDGAIVHIKHSKTDKLASGARIGISFASRIECCPIRSLRDWIDELASQKITEGRLFRRVYRSGKIGDRLGDLSIADIVKKYVAMIGFDRLEFSGHSLRRGFASSADAGGASFTNIMNQGRWKTASVCRGYLEKGELFNNGNAELGL